MSLIGAIETGGTKTMCAIADGDRIIADTRIPTTTVEETVGAIREFFADQTPLAALAVASFGPLDTNPESDTFGWITTTPKSAWINTDLRGLLSDLSATPLSFVTDVTGSLVGEQTAGALVATQDSAYITVGTGVGVGLMVRGDLVTGRATPEVGHMIVRRHRDDDYGGICRYHGDCLEGMAAGPAVHARWGRPAEGTEVSIIASYIAQLCSMLALSLSPERIVLGGGVPKTPGLMEEVRLLAADYVNGYLGDGHPIANPDSGYIVPPQLGDQAALVGAVALAQASASG